MANHAAADTKVEVEKAFATFDTTFNKLNAKDLAALYTQDSKLFPGDTTAHQGPQAVEKVFAGFFQAGVHGHKLALLDCGADGSLIWACAKWTAKDANKAEIGGTAFVVFERQNASGLKLRFHGFK